MKFVYPEFLWALFALLIPIIIHLFNFRRYKKLYFSSLTFIKQVDQQTKSTKRLRHFIILLSRLLALGLIILAFAQPFIPAKNENENGGKPVLAIYIDNSFSMTAKGTEGELLSESREMARKMINDASLETRILLNTNYMGGLEQRLLTKAEALEKIDKINPTPLIRQLDDVLNWQRNFLNQQNNSNEKLGTRQYVFFSDFQTVTSSFSNLKKDESSFYYPIKLIPQIKGNCYVDSVWFSSPIQRTGQNNELNIRVVNDGEEDLTNVEVHVDIEGINRDVFMDLPANKKSTTTVNYTEPGPGFKIGKVSVNDKQLFWDDDYHFSYSVKEKVNVLVLNGESNNASVSQVYNLEKYYKVSSINQGSFTNDQLNGMDLLFLNGIDELPSSLAETVKSFVESGGTVALFPGGKCEFSSWNALLNNLSLPNLGSTISAGTKIDRLIYEDPFFSGMFDKKKENLNLPSVAKSYRIIPNGNSQFFELIKMQNGMPLFLKAKNGLNAFLFTSSLESSFGTFTSDALFPSIVLRIGEMSQRKAPTSITIGKESFYPLYNKADNETPIHIKNEKIDFIPSTKKIGLINYLSLSGNEALERLLSGSYELVDESKLGVLSLNYDRIESSTKALSKEEIEEGLKPYFKNIAYREISQGQSLTKIDIDRPFEYWMICLLMGGLFLILEMLIIKLWK